ncbi:MAG: methyltransferase domain-containing protein [Anaerolineae bacterium]|nr:methyltransferase domain-containing protein [Anaerolineae bacterium]
MSDLGRTEYITFDRAADFYDATRGFPEGQESIIADLFAQAGNLRHGSRVLEVGIGTGRIALPLARHTGKLYGIDLSRAMMERLRAKAGAEAIQLSKANALRLPFRRSAFDAVVLVHVLHLIADWQGVLREIARVLKPEGVLLCGDTHGNTLHSPVFEPIWTAWRAVFPEGKVERIGLAQPVAEALPPLGWQPLGEPRRHTYTVMRSPQSVYQALAQRHWSSTWQLSETELAQGLAAVQAAIQANYSEPDQLLSLQVSFEVQAFRPPQHNL